MNILLLAGIAFVVVVSVRSAQVVGMRGPWTTAGWLLTIGWAAAAVVEVIRPDLHAAAASVAYGFVIALVVTFIIAGVRDEPQAEPWYAPRTLGKTRAQRRALR